VSCRIVKPEPAGVKHPAKYSPELLPQLARYVDGARTILDPFAGVGRVGMLRPHLTQPARHLVQICANELEEPWGEVAWSNGCNAVRIGDARTVTEHWAPGWFDAVVTSPAYGNRMADAANWAPGRRHSTYTSALRETVGSDRRELRPGNAGAMPWGDLYRELHREAWCEAWAVLRDGGRLVLNIADHYAAGELQGVPEWHVSALLAIGFELLDWLEVPTKRYKAGANSDLRAPELVILFEKPGDPPVDWRLAQVGMPGHYVAGSNRLWDVQPEPVQLSLLGDRP
jgi:hypothetical protein